MSKGPERTIVDRVEFTNPDVPIDLKSEFLTHIEERKYLGSRAASLRDRFGNPTHKDYYSWKARIYRGLEFWGLKRVAERLIPIETTEAGYFPCKDGGKKNTIKHFFRD